MKTKKEKSKKELTPKEKLLLAKLNWRVVMRKFFGKGWTKRTASKIHPDGRRHMNLPNN